MSTLTWFHLLHKGSQRVYLAIHPSSHRHHVRCLPLHSHILHPSLLRHVPIKTTNERLSHSRWDQVLFLKLLIHFQTPSSLMRRDCPPLKSLLEVGVELRAESIWNGLSKGEVGFGRGRGGGKSIDPIRFFFRRGRRRRVCVVAVKW